MSTSNDSLSPQESQAIPFWRDVRVLGVLGQIGFIIFVLFIAQTLGANFAENISKLGEAQFICRDGTHSVRCAYDFMGSEAAFDISETILDYEITDSYWYAIFLGFLNTLKVAVIGVIIATILGVLVGIARLSDNWLISTIMKWYIELIRNTPLLIQLFFLYFTVLLALPSVDEAIQPLGLPIYLSNRGLSLPSFVFTPNFPVFFAILVLGIIQFQVIYVALGRKEDRTGKPTNRLAIGVTSFIIIVGLGWIVATNASDNQGLLVSKATRIRKLDDIEKIMLNRTGLNHLDDLSQLTDEELKASEFKVCVLRDSSAESNLATQLRDIGVPFSFVRTDRPDQATERYVGGACDAFAGPQSMLAAERPTLENPGNYLILPVKEYPVAVSIPGREGLNIAGGTKLTPEYTALTLGLIVYTAAFIAEIVRAGILSVSKGQSEAARAIGLSEGQRLQLIVLPQALRVIIPPLTSQYLNLTKNSSLAIAVGFPDLYSVSLTTMNQSGRAIQLFIIIMLTYLTISLSTSALLNWYNERVKLVER